MHRIGKTARRACVFMLLCAITCTMIACGAKNVDYNVGDDKGETDQINLATGSLAEQLSVPFSCDMAFETGNTGLTVFTCKAESIDVPDVTSVSKVYYGTFKFDSESVKEITESLLDKSEGIYAREDGARTKDELQYTIDSYQELADDAAESGDNEMVEYYQGLVGELTSVQKSAPSELPEVTEYTTDGSYYGKRNEHESVVSFSNALSSSPSGVVFGLSLTDDEKLKIASEEDGATGFMLDTDMGGDAYDTENMTNVCKKTKESALGEALSFIESMGITGLSCKQSGVLVWNWYNEQGSVKLEANGYAFRFSRQIDGIYVADKELQQVENLSVNLEGFIETATDYMYVYVDDTGVVEASGMIYTDGDSLKIGDEMQLLTWDDMISRAEESLGTYYETYQSQSGEVEFDSVSFAYLAYADDDGRACFIPVWEFLQSGDNADDRLNAKQLAYISAVDGSYIDLVANAKRLGAWSE